MAEKSFMGRLCNARDEATFGGDCAACHAKVGAGEAHQDNCPVMALADAIEALDEYDKSFEIYDKAIRRGTRYWQRITRGRGWPDTAKLITWMISTLGSLMPVIDALQEYRRAPFFHRGSLWGRIIAAAEDALLDMKNITKPYAFSNPRKAVDELLEALLESENDRDRLIAALAVAGNDIHCGLCASDCKPPHCIAHMDVICALERASRKIDKGHD
jgi:hypothetical protein